MSVEARPSNVRLGRPETRTQEANHRKYIVSAHGGTYVDPRTVDTTLTTCEFASGVQAHIFVSWLHPFKEQKLAVVGNKKMAVFDDLQPEVLAQRVEFNQGLLDRVSVQDPIVDLDDVAAASQDRGPPDHVLAHRQAAR